MNNNILLEVLNCLTDDYENIESIKSMLMKLPRITLNNDGILTNLKTLYEKGLIDVLKFNVDTSTYDKINYSPDNQHNIYYSINAIGRKYLADNWG